MDEDLIPFLLVYLVTYIMVLTVARRDEIAVRGGILVFLIMICLFAPIKVAAFGYITNISVIPSAAFVSCLTILAIDFGFRYAMRIVLVVAQWLIYMQLVIFFMTKINTLTFVEGNLYNLVASIISDNTVHSFFATYVSAILSTMGIAGIVAWCPCRRFYKYMLASMAAFFFGGLAFYTLAFTGDPKIIQIMILSIPIKIIMTLMYYPIVGQMQISEHSTRAMLQPHEVK